MNPSQPEIEDLLLTKDYTALSRAERALADATYGGAAGYAAERALRRRTQAALRAEAVPADPRGWAAVAARTRPRRVVPLWQAAAAVALVAVLAWWGRGWMQPSETLPEEVRLAVADTIRKEVRVVDTVYLPAPRFEEAAPVPAPPRQRRVERREPVRKPPVRNSPVAEVSMPDPAIVAATSGAPAAGGDIWIEVVSDKMGQ